MVYEVQISDEEEREMARFGLFYDLNKVWIYITHLWGSYWQGEASLNTAAP